LRQAYDYWQDQPGNFVVKRERTIIKKEKRLKKIKQIKRSPSEASFTLSTLSMLPPPLSHSLQFPLQLFHTKAHKGA